MTRLIRAWLALGLAGSGAVLDGPAALFAQATSLEAGTRVRVRSPGLAPQGVIGTVIAASADSIHLRAVDSTTMGIALTRRTRVDRSAGVRNHTMTGALLGGGLGAAAAVAFLSGFCGGDNVCNGDEEVRAAGYIVLPAMAIGMAIGAVTRTERWEPVAFASPSTSGKHRVSLGLAVRW